MRAEEGARRRVRISARNELYSIYLKATINCGY